MRDPGEVLGHAASGGADTGEVLATAQRIVSGDYDSWHDEWLATAERIAREAESAVNAGHRVQWPWRSAPRP